MAIVLVAARVVPRPGAASVALGLAWSLLGHVVFGALGGVLGSLTLTALRRAGFFAYVAEKRWPPPLPCA